MIREAEVRDFPAILDLSREFWTHTMFSEPFEAEHTQKMVEMAYDHELLAVLEVDDHIVGFVAGISSFLLGSTQAKCGTELAWWVKPAHRGGRNGIALLNFIEQLAARNGIKYWTMVSMESSMPEQVGKMYEKMGYARSETSYTKVLKWQQSQQQQS